MFVITELYQYTSVKTFGYGIKLIAFSMRVLANVKCDLNYYNTWREVKAFVFE